MRLKILALSTVAVSACSGGSPPPGPSPAPVSGASDYEGATERAAARILPNRIRQHITFLASDELAGRDTPSPGLETAASYLVETLQEAGLEPAGENGTFIQRFPYTRTAMVTASRQVDYRLAGSTRDLEYARDYYVIPGQLSAANAGVVFGGRADQPSAGLAQIANGKVAVFTTEGNPVVILIARGDLGVEMSLAKLPGLQKMIIEKCRKAKKPVIVATQMLDSMIENSTPTRAEVNDVANAVYEGADAVMLSGETAIGKYPIETLQIMQEILLNTEQEIYHEDISNKISVEIDRDNRSAIGESVKLISKHLSINAIVVMTESGSTAIIVSHYRPRNNIFALTPYRSICNKLSLVWGVIPLMTEEFESTDEMIIESEKLLIKRGLLKLGDTFVLTAGVPVGVSGTTNMLKIHKITTTD